MILSFTGNRPSHKRRFASGHNKGNLKGGRIKSTDGYWLVRNTDHPRADIIHGYVREHILIFEKYHECCLLKWGVVHHINEIKTDNRIENLQGMSRRQHISLHTSGKKQSTEGIRKRILTLKSKIKLSSS